MTIKTFPASLRNPEEFEWELLSATQTFESPLSKSAQTLELVGAARWKSSMTWRDLTVSDQRILFAFLASLRGQAGRYYQSDISFPTNAGSELGTPLVNGADVGVDGPYSGVATIGLDAGSRELNIGEYIKFSNQSTIYQITNVTGVSGTAPTIIQTVTLHRNITTDLTTSQTAAVYHTGSSLYTDGWMANESGVLIAGDYFNIGDNLLMVTEDANSDANGEAILTVAPSIRTNFADDSALNFTDKQAVMRLIDDSQTKMKVREPVLSSFTISSIESFV